MSQIDETPVDSGGQIKAFHIIVVFLSLFLTFFAWQFSRQQIETRVFQRFEASRDSVIALIVDRMEKYEDALWAGVAAIESHGGDISYEDWHVFAQSLDIHEKYPGINGIGVIHFHTEQTLDEYLSVQRGTRPQFRIFPDHDQPMFMPITYIEPESSNAAAIGLDVAHEVNRRSAALASRDTGTSQITGPITLVQDETSTAGFLFYTPFRKDGVPAGAVYAPFVVHKLMEGLLATELHNVRFSIQDQGTVIYDRHAEGDRFYDPDPMYSGHSEIDIYGRTWVVDVQTNLSFRGQNTYSQPTFILVAGLVIEALIIALLFLLAKANRRAIAYADQATVSLQQKTARLDATNKELFIKNEALEEFAYIASHDLKTPIRGINGLTEMIEEDLEGYFASPEANPEVQQNLKLIQTRVVRMNQLTQGIMEYAKVEVHAKENGVLDLERMLVDLVLDLGLNDGQLVLEGDVKSLGFDTINLRRVLENLIGNAVKYHQGAEPLQVVVSARQVDDRCCFSVADNGPGIDPKFHDRIFKVFQTLRLADMPESTGIGLAIVKKAVERNAGKIGLQSEEGKGSTFRFDWPGSDTSTQHPVSREAA
ncbi:MULTISPECIES: CHASE domain-containing protein [unclassified Sulfitobacter]|uniref:CHASE domain-containing protein n=1 Tax=unclassified Sulfitobacter TaxID=196795 RepID=UPI0023E2E53B|nr:MULTISPECIES: CHASE domain-containing protein [unclassified Sulfitobacter]